MSLSRLSTHSLSRTAVASALVGLTATLLAAVHVAPAGGAPPWAQLIPFQKKAAPARTVSSSIADLTLGEKDGPWLIMCSTFVGEAGEMQAMELAQELRSRHRMQAFVYHQHFDFTQDEIGLGLNKYGGPKKMKAMRQVEFDEHAVMIGNFQSVDDPLLEKTLQQVKTLNPNIFSKAKQAEAQAAAQGGPKSAMDALSQPLDRIREYYKSIAPNDERKTAGPLAKAFVTRNPLLPDEFFVAKGLDPFIVRLNKDLPFSLLKNPKKYTVRVATFRGIDTMKGDKEFDKLTSAGTRDPKIDQAAEKAHMLCEALRGKGVEAYEFHDTSESIVTIGSFDSVGDERADGKTEINRAVLAIMQEYSAERKAIPGLNQLGTAPKSIPGVNYGKDKTGQPTPVYFDPQPMPVEVPRQSLAANYNPSNSALR